MESATSTNGVPIRLTDERWTHIVENHDEMAGRRDDVLAVIEGLSVTNIFGGQSVRSKNPCENQGLERPALWLGHQGLEDVTPDLTISPDNVGNRQD